MCTAPSPPASPASTYASTYAPMAMSLCDMLQAGRKNPDFLGEEEMEEDKVLRHSQKHWAGVFLVCMILCASVLPLSAALFMINVWPELQRQKWTEHQCQVGLVNKSIEICVC